MATSEHITQEYDKSNNI